MNSRFFWRTYFGVLIRCDGREGRLGESEGLENTPADAEEVVGLDDVEAWVVSMHGVQDDLQKKKEVLAQSTFCEEVRASPRGLVLTWPCWSSVLLVSFSLRKETDCFIQWLPGAGESGWRYVLQGGWGSAFPATSHFSLFHCRKETER